jgi:hypothetical protein
MFACRMELVVTTNNKVMELVCMPFYILTSLVSNSK